MRTGILGGTFDPIHTGHLIMAENAYDYAGLDRVILMPTGRSYFKDGTGVTAPQLRYQMTLAAAQDNPHFEVSDLETTRPGKTYTADTLEELHKMYPEDELFYIVGADTLMQLSLWREPEKVFRLASILVAARQDEAAQGRITAEAGRLEQTYGARIQFLPSRNIEISSTDIRERVGDGKSIRYLVPLAVENFIRDHQLYEEKWSHRGQSPAATSGMHAH